jgi:ethanolamine ammonia-lyase small subunit
MPDDLTQPTLASWLEAARRGTPARVLVGRVGPAYSTATQLTLRADHAAALDAVGAELDLDRDFGAEFAAGQGLFAVSTQAASKAEFLARPERGRRLNDAAAALVRQRCPQRPDLQIVIGDGLSATAVRMQTPLILPLLCEGALQRGWRPGQPFVVRHCRVGILNEIGELLDPVVAVLLIGERPGLATAESLSAYLAYRPRFGHTDARRNLVSNIHGRGVGAEDAVRRILALAEEMRRLQTSGVAIKERLPARAIVG